MLITIINMFVVCNKKSMYAQGNILQQNHFVARKVFSIISDHKIQIIFLHNASRTLCRISVGKNEVGAKL